MGIWIVLLNENNSLLDALNLVFTVVDFCQLMLREITRGLTLSIGH